MCSSGSGGREQYEGWQQHYVDYYVIYMLFWPVGKLKLVQVSTLMWLSSEHCGTLLVRFSEKQTVSAMQR